jgi:hypothetical protein
VRSRNFYEVHFSKETTMASKAKTDLETNTAIALRLVEVFKGRRLDLLEDVLHPEFRGRGISAFAPDEPEECKSPMISQRRARRKAESRSTVSTLKSYTYTEPLKNPVHRLLLMPLDAMPFMVYLIRHGMGR